MAHTKAQGSVKGNRDSIAKRLGVKLFGGQKAKIGSILVRQKGTKFFPGVGVALARDYSLYAIRQGKVRFRKLAGKKIVEVLNG